VISVLIADAQPLVRAGLTAVLNSEPDIEVVGEAGDGRQAIEQARALQPDVVLMDIRMPVLDGLAAAREIAVYGLKARILILTTFDLDEYVYEALRIGASGFMLKDSDGGDLIHAVRTVARGDQIVAPALTRRLIERFTHTPPRRPARDHDAVRQLTDRELDVLLALSRGKSNAEIAQTLYLSEATVKTHLTRILAKLNLRDRVQLVVFAYEHGLVEQQADEANRR
jgi:DNA-binding NarL/FixJ family response regulator